MERITSLWRSQPAGQDCLAHTHSPGSNELWSAPSLGFTAVANHQSSHSAHAQFCHHHPTPLCFYVLDLSWLYCRYCCSKIRCGTQEMGHTTPPNLSMDPLNRERVHGVQNQACTDRYKVCSLRSWVDGRAGWELGSWGYHSVVEHMPSMCNILDSVPSATQSGHASPSL